MGDKHSDIENLTVQDFMIHDPLTITPEAKISTTELLMLKKKIGGLPVIKNKKEKQLIGIITQRDIRLARFALNLESPNTSVRDLMTKDPKVVYKSDSIKKTLRIMFENNIERLPVINQNNEIIGLVIQQDILKAIYSHLN
ncbi:MAG: CBS domain-containing protein [Candidatus Lokiarchaeota archaeon]|nr:CBS domain-containing protein [Candidatus Lokiarchaeota archaeon]